ncbi:MAG TPA: HEAT repeat domain-containing protein [Anaerolineae bacterium]|nr:HEAT repeat domain-containing protein [Anaerolineae bacterium]
MKLPELLKALESISPLPEDDKCSEELLGQYQELLMIAETFDDPRLIKPLLQSVGYGYGFGLYHTVRHILESYPAEDLLPALLQGLQDANAGTRMKCADMLGPFENPNHIPYLLPLLQDDKELVRACAGLSLSRFAKNYPEIEVQLLQLKDDP